MISYIFLFGLFVNLQFTFAAECSQEGAARALDSEVQHLDSENELQS